MSSHRVRSKDKCRTDLDLVYEEEQCERGGKLQQGWWCILCKYVPHLFPAVHANRAIQEEP
jgi:hypothetical protein